jgi:hypothetical protein
MEKTKLKAMGFKNMFTPILTQINTLVQYCKEARFRQVFSAHARLDMTNCYTAQTVQGTRKQYVSLLCDTHRQPKPEILAST